MSPALLAPPSGAIPGRRNFWQRRLTDPIRTQLGQGMAPDKIAATLAVGTACSLFPFPGFTALLNFVVGLPLRMNQPVLQTLNQLLGPVQLALILAYVRWGELLWRSDAARFTIGGMVRAFRDTSVPEFLRHFGWAGVHALTAWLITSPLLIATVYFAARPLLRRVVQKQAS